MIGRVVGIRSAAGEHSPDCFENEGLGRRVAQVRPKVSEGQCGEHPSRKGIPIEELAKIVAIFGIKIAGA